MVTDLTEEDPLAIAKSELQATLGKNLATEILRYWQYKLEQRYMYSFFVVDQGSANSDL